ncbi:unnamed protein product, partial [Amoebophrya sp. A25]
NIVFVQGAFRISPASFYLEQNQAVEVTFAFKDMPSVPIGVSELPWILEANNFTSVAGSVRVLVDTLRIELLAFAKEQ